MSLEFFDEVETTVANTHFLRAVKDAKQKAPVDLHLTDFDQLGEFEKTYVKRLDIRSLLKPQKVAYYQFRKFLVEDGPRSWLELIENCVSYRRGKFLERKQKALAIYAKYLVEPVELQTETKSPDDLKDKLEKDPVPSNQTSDPLKPEPSLVDTKQTLSDPALPDQEKQPKEDQAAAEQVSLLPKDDTSEKAGEVEKPVVAPPVDTVTLAEVRKILITALTARVIERIRVIIDQHVIPPGALFDAVMQVVANQLNDRIPAFFKTSHYRRLIQLAHYAKRPIGYKDFRIFRPLGRGSFGTVYAVQKIDTGAIYAMKEMNKKHVKADQSEWSVQTEKKSFK